MDIAKMLNVTILACLLILTGCFGLGATDDDVIDDAEGGSATVIDTYPPVQSLVGNETITTSMGEYVEILEVWWYGSSDWRDVTISSVNYYVSCDTVSGEITSSSVSQGDYLLSDGLGCEYTFISDDDFNIIYRVWS